MNTWTIAAMRLQSDLVGYFLEQGIPPQGAQAYAGEYTRYFLTSPLCDAGVRDLYARSIADDSPIELPVAPPLRQDGG